MTREAPASGGIRQFTSVTHRDTGLQYRNLDHSEISEQTRTYPHMVFVPSVESKPNDDMKTATEQTQY